MIKFLAWKTFKKKISLESSTAENASQLCARYSHSGSSGERILISIQYLRQQKDSKVGGKKQKQDPTMQFIALANRKYLRMLDVSDFWLESSSAEEGLHVRTV